MAEQLGELGVGSAISHIFPTVAGGELTALGGSPEVTVVRHSDLTTSQSGVSLSQGINPGGGGAITGLHRLAITQSSSATFYQEDDHYTAYFSVGTLAGVSLVGQPILEWSTEALSGTKTNQSVALNTMQTGTVDDTNHSPTTTEFETSDITVSAAQHFNGRSLIFTSGTLIRQATSISGYSLVSGRGHFTVVQLTSAPAAGVSFIIV